MPRPNGRVSLGKYDGRQPTITEPCALRDVTGVRGLHFISKRFQPGHWCCGIWIVQRDDQTRMIRNTPRNVRSGSRPLANNDSFVSRARSAFAGRRGLRGILKQITGSRRARLFPKVIATKILSPPGCRFDGVFEVSGGTGRSQLRILRRQIVERG